jgi:hypothetical protein
MVSAIIHLANKDYPLLGWWLSSNSTELVTVPPLFTHGQGTVAMYVKTAAL